MIKAKYIAYICAALTAFFTPIVPDLIFVSVLIIGDFITGVSKAIKKGEVSSRKMVKKFYDTIGYFTGIIVAAYVQKYFGEQIPIVKATLAIIALTEIQSLRENILSITGTDVLKPLISVLKKKSEEV